MQPSKAIAYTSPRLLLCKCIEYIHYLAISDLNHTYPLLYDLENRPVDMKTKWCKNRERDRLKHRKKDS